MTTATATTTDAGIVTRQPGPEDDAPFPETFWVELGHALGDDEP